MILRFCSTSWEPETIIARAAAGSVTGDSGGPSAAWPLARARATVYHLHGDGRLATARAEQTSNRTTYTFDPLHPVPTVGGNISSNHGLITAGGYDQRPRDDTHAAGNRLPLSERRDVLVFRTEPLAADLEVTGTVQVKLWVSSTAPDTDFTAKLIDEIPPNPDYPLGFDLNIGDSILRPRYREGLDHQAAPLKPDEIVPITITLYPTSNVFKQGHRIRLDISSSNYPRFDVNPNTGDPLGDYRRMIPADNTVYHDPVHPSQLILPVISSTTDAGSIANDLWVESRRYFTGTDTACRMLLSASSCTKATMARSLRAISGSDVGNGRSLLESLRYFSMSRFRSTRLIVILSSPDPGERSLPSRPPGKPRTTWSWKRRPLVPT